MLSGRGAFVDMNGDCKPDLVFLTDLGIEIWLAGDLGYNQLSKPMPLPYPASDLIFADFNGDGTIDVLTWQSGSADVYLLLNSQSPLCSSAFSRSISAGTCRPDSALCQGASTVTLGGMTSDVEGAMMAVGSEIPGTEGDRFFW
jgi:hypothetical protein